MWNDRFCKRKKRWKKMTHTARERQAGKIKERAKGKYTHTQTHMPPPTYTHLPSRFSVWSEELQWRAAASAFTPAKVIVCEGMSVRPKRLTV